MKENKKNMIFIGALGVFVLLAILSMANSTFAKPIGNVQTAQQQIAVPSDGTVQTVKLQVKNSQYVLEPSTLKVGVPVRLEADMSTITGCTRTIVIPGFNVKKTVSNSDNIIEFVPNKVGTFNVACGMNMVRGTFQVVQEGGTPSSYVEPAATGGTCGGSSGGGCGCGGGSY